MANIFPGFVSDGEFSAIFPQVALAHETLHSKTGPGSDFLGWVDLPENYDKEEFARIKAAAKKIQQNSQVLVVIGIGGSYLGARAVIECAEGQPLQRDVAKGTPQIFFVGNSITPGLPANDVIALCEGKDILGEHHLQIRHHHRAGAGLPRVPRALLEDKYGKEGARERIYCHHRQGPQAP